MGDLYVPRTDAEVLKAIDTDVLRNLVDQCIREERPSAVRTLRLDGCGPYVSSRLRAFEDAIAAHQKAKSAKKRSTTEYDLRSAGSDLTHAVHQMKHRVATEEQESQLFYVDDNVMVPSRFSEQLTVRISYQWRASASDPWSYGSIVFSHTDQPRSEYLLPTAARKPSAAQKGMRAANPCWPQAAVMAGAQMVAGCQRWGSNSSTRLALCVGSLVSTSLR